MYIITTKPLTKPIVESRCPLGSQRGSAPGPPGEWAPCAMPWHAWWTSGSSWSTTTQIIAPAAKASAYGSTRHGHDEQRADDAADRLDHARELAVHKRAAPASLLPQRHRDRETPGKFWCPIPIAARARARPACRVVRGRALASAPKLTRPQALGQVVRCAITSSSTYRQPRVVGAPPRRHRPLPPLAGPVGLAVLELRGHALQAAAAAARLRSEWPPPSPLACALAAACRASPAERAAARLRGLGLVRLHKLERLARAPSARARRRLRRCPRSRAQSRPRPARRADCAPRGGELERRREERPEARGSHDAGRAEHRRQHRLLASAVVRKHEHERRPRP